MLRSGVGVVSQFGVETTPGTGVAANRFTPTLNWIFARMIEPKNFRARGSRINSTSVHHKKMAQGSVEGVLDYNSLMYQLSGIFNHPTRTQIGSIGAYQGIWTPGVTSADSTRKTYTVEIGDATAVEEYNFVQLKGWDLEAGQDDFTSKSDAIGRYPEDAQTITASPTTVAERPVERNDVNLYMDDAVGSLGGTQITNAMEESLSLGDKFKEAFFHNRSAGEFEDVVETPYEPKFSFTTAHNAQSEAIVALVENNPYKFLRWEAQGALLGTHSSVDYYELIRIDMCGKFEGVEPMINDDEPYAYKYNFTLLNNATLGSYMKVTNINSIAVASF